jgi:hypothetical protein
MDTGLQLTKRERQIQTDVCEMEWPDEPEDRWAIVKLIADFIDETGTSQRRTAVIIGWPKTTLADRLETFRRSAVGTWGAARPRSSGRNGSLEKAKRMFKAHATEFMEDPSLRSVAFDALDETELHPVSRPSTAPARRTSAAERNVSAVALAADAHTALERANTLADFASLTEHQLANVEIAHRACEAEIAVWRENAGGGISDEAIQTAMAGGV